MSTRGDRSHLLQEAGALSVLVFSFFEYVLYRGIVLGVAAPVQSIWRQWRESRRRQANTTQGAYRGAGKLAWSVGGRRGWAFDLAEPDQ